MRTILATLLGITRTFLVGSWHACAEVAPSVDRFFVIAVVCAIAVFPVSQANASFLAVWEERAAEIAIEIKKTMIRNL